MYNAFLRNIHFFLNLYAAVKLLCIKEILFKLFDVCLQFEADLRRLHDLQQTNQSLEVEIEKLSKTVRLSDKLVRVFCVECVWFGILLSWEILKAVSQ